MDNLSKSLRIGQGHLEIGLYEWQAIIDRYVTNRQPKIKFFSQLTTAEMDEIIKKIEAVLTQQQAAPPPPPQAEPEPVAVQAAFW